MKVKSMEHVDNIDAYQGKTIDVRRSIVQKMFQVPIVHPRRDERWPVVKHVQAEERE
jgi:hypothetical protein